MNVDVDKLGIAITNALETYDQQVSDGIKRKVREVAEECREELYTTSPEKTGDYRKGWTTKVQYESERDIRIVVHNKTDYQLTHLLEYGHNGPGGVKKDVARKIPHIRPAEEKAAAKLVNEAKVVLR